MDVVEVALLQLFHYKFLQRNFSVNGYWTYFEEWPDKGQFYSLKAWRIYQVAKLCHLNQNILMIYHLISSRKQVVWWWQGNISSEKKGHAKVQQFSLLVKNGIAESDKRKNVRVFKGAITPPFFKDLASKWPLKATVKNKAPKIAHSLFGHSSKQLSAN